MISDPLDLNRFLVTPGVEVMNLTFAADACVWVSWKHSETEEIPGLKQTYEVVAAFVTAGARIHLYSYLDMLKDKILYCDTDSIIYVEKLSEAPLVQTGECLGEVTYEIKAGQYISEFVSGGPKDCGYTICDSHTTEAVKTVCKVRGITLNYATSKVVNFDMLKDMVMKRDPGSRVTVYTAKKIKRKRQSGAHAGGPCVSIVTEPESKIYRISFLKRRRLEDNHFLPYGY